MLLTLLFFFFEIMLLISILSCRKTTQNSTVCPVWLGAVLVSESSWISLLFCCWMMNLRLGLKCRFVTFSHVSSDNLLWSRGTDFAPDWACCDLQPKQTSLPQQSQLDEPGLVICATDFFFFHEKLLLMTLTLPMEMHFYLSCRRSMESFKNTEP